MNGNNIDVIDLVGIYNTEPRPEYVVINGPLSWPPDGISTSTGITFTRPDTYVKLPPWRARNSGTLSFSFRTTEPHGLMMYNGGRPGTSDFVAIEMYDGILYFVIDVGSGVKRYRFSNDQLNDGQPHEVRFSCKMSCVP